MYILSFERVCVQVRGLTRVASHIYLMDDSTILGVCGAVLLRQGNDLQHSQYWSCNETGIYIYSRDTGIAILT